MEKSKQVEIDEVSTSRPFAPGRITPSIKRKKFVLLQLKILFEDNGIHVVEPNAPDSKAKQEFHIFFDELHTWDTSEDEYEEQIYEITGYY